MSVVTVAPMFIMVLAIFPTNLSAFLASTTKSNPSIPLRASSLQNSNSIDHANEALEQLDVQAAEAFLMTAVAEVNGAVMNHPPLLQCFENLFRTKIQIAQTQPLTDDVAYAIAQDRMGLASLLTDQSNYQQAADELELAVKSLSSLPTSPNQQMVLDNASSLLFRTRAMVCDWDQYPQASDALVQSTQSALAMGVPPAVHPFEALAWPCLTLQDATSIAHEYAKRAMASKYTNTNETTNLPWSNLNERLPRTNVPFVRAITESLKTTKKSSSSQPILKVGYLSPDFTGKHPLAFLMQDVFRFHDTDQFEIVLYSLGGPPDGSPEVDHILHGRTANDKVASRKWKTLEGSVEAMAQTIADDQLDVVIDLCGYTGTSLVAEVMACLKGLAASSPVHVGYMGFPGSSGAPYMDYMIADATVIPSKVRPWYTENILFMPHCYFVNSHWHIKANQNNVMARDRESYGLPPAPAFVFCCHSRPDKIDPSTFVAWIRALQRTRSEGRATGNESMANAVLWLLRSKGAPQMEGNLLQVAKNILGAELHDAIVFCDQAPRDQHLERLALADLYLDTPAYNAHTVGCDCLSAGVPMISLLLPLHCNENETSQQSVVPTEKLASRVGASLLQSATRSPELTDVLVVSSMQEYEDRMVECASSEHFDFGSLQQDLLQDFDRAPLWDTERWVRNLETGLTTMVDLKRKQADETDIYVMDYNHETDKLHQ